MGLERFCGERLAKFDISAPWVHDGWRYYTDGRIAIRTPANGALDESRSVPKAYKVFKAFPKCMKKWPKIKATRCVCPCCGQSHERVDHRKIAGRSLNGYYLKLISDELTDVRYCPKGKPDEALAFSAAGGVQGLLMPMGD